MSSADGINDALAASEMLRRVREIAWSVVAGLLFVPVIALVVLMADKSIIQLVADRYFAATIVATAVSIGILIRVLQIAIRLGKEMRDPARLKETRAHQFYWTYFAARVFGFR
jgi:hypothetical protein